MLQIELFFFAPLKQPSPAILILNLLLTLFRTEKKGKKTTKPPLDNDLPIY